MRTTILLCLMVFGACGSGTVESAIDVTRFRFEPEAVTVDAGTTVTWTNLDEIEHTVTAGTPDEPDTERLDHVFEATPPDTFSFTFEEPGTHPYFCSRHDFMQAEIQVL